MRTPGAGFVAGACALLVACGPASSGRTGNTIAAPAPAIDRCEPPRDHAEDTLEVRRLAAREVGFGDVGTDGEAERVRILAFNDFHGQLGAGRTVEGRPVGGAAVLAAYLREAAGGRLEAAFVVHAGDMIGASPPASALHQDEPSIEFFGMLGNEQCARDRGADPRCNLVVAVGNHELDEGQDELLRLASGGDHAAGPFLGRPYPGPRFRYLAANLVRAGTKETIFEPSVVRRTPGGASVGFVAALVRGAGRYLPPRGIAGLEFRDEADSINDAVADLQRQGVGAVVVVLHQGGEQDFTAKEGPEAVSGKVAGIVTRLDDAVDLVVSGHTHALMNALLPNRAGRPIPVVQAGYAGTAFADVEVAIDGRSGDVLGGVSRIVSTFADEGAGLEPDPKVAAFVERVEDAVAAMTEVVVGEAAAALPLQPSCSGESALGNLLADAQRAAMGTDVALVTPAWVRAEIAAGPVTWGDLFAVQPFGNDLVSVSIRGDQLLVILEGQWTDPYKVRVFHVSGLAYTWDENRPPGARVRDARIGGSALDPGTNYTLAVSDFLADGGDELGILAALPRVARGPKDVEALADHIRKRGQPLTADLEGRISRVPLEAR
jgi:5'-nucleotidase